MGGALSRVSRVLSLASPTPRGGANREQPALSLCTSPNSRRSVDETIGDPEPRLSPDQPTRTHWEGGQTAAQSRRVGLELKASAVNQSHSVQRLGYSVKSPIGEQKHNRYEMRVDNPFCGAERTQSQGKLSGQWKSGYIRTSADCPLGLGWDQGYPGMSESCPRHLAEPANQHPSSKGRQTPKLVDEDQSQQGRTHVRRDGARAVGLSGETLPGTKVTVEAEALRAEFEDLASNYYLCHLFLSRKKSPIGNGAPR
ncbi:hypothetical protein EDB89DRAFT_1908996 [Lactarius sanguifluus]|nr:hypothetical protein EDB89DRAFT_1908996 [Lactarius sanguifluus]